MVLHANRIAAVRARLLDWYDTNARDLPWRRTGDPYRIWLSETMLQQTRVETVIPYYERWLEHLPTVADLAAADEEQVLKLWEGLGYYRRARNLHRAAREVMASGGRLPATAKDWQTLPGVGRYTAGAVASIAFGEPAPLVDGNVKRVLARFEGIDRSIDDRRVEQRMWLLAEALVPEDRPGDFNQALMELGARVCVPKRPRCLACPLHRACRARRDGRQDELPVRKARKPVPEATWVAGLVEQGGRFLLAKRPATGLLAGLWELPSGTARDGEPHAEALTRIARDDLGLVVRVGVSRGAVDHAFTHLKVRIHLYACDVVRGTLRAHRHQATRWVPPDALGEAALPVAFRKLITALQASPP